MGEVLVPRQGSCSQRGLKQAEIEAMLELMDVSFSGHGAHLRLLKSSVHTHLLSPHGTSAPPSVAGKREPLDTGSSFWCA